MFCAGGRFYFVKKDCGAIKNGVLHIYKQMTKLQFYFVKKGDLI